MSKAKLIKLYPRLDDRSLPFVIGCPVEFSIEEAQQGFKRICFKDAIVIAVEVVEMKCNPVCIWRVYYQMKNKDHDYEDGDNSNSNIPPSELPKDEASLRQLFEDLTSVSHCLGMDVVRKCHTEDKLVVIVDYSPKECQGHFQNFSEVTTEPIKEAEVNFSRMKIYM